MVAADAYDVVIVGGGPAGSATAALLARAGVRVALLDRSRFPRPKACAEYFSPGVVETLQRLDLWQGVAGLPHARLKGMELVGPAGLRHLVAYPPDPAPRRSLAMRRDVLDAALVEQARHAGAVVRLGCAVRDIVLDGVRAVGVVIQDANRQQALPARLVIGADGARSLVARRLGLEARTHWPARLGLIAHYEGVHALTSQGEMHVGRGVYCGLAPLGGGTLNVGMVTSLATARRLGSAEAIFAWMLVQLPAVGGILAAGRRVGRLRGVAPLAHRCRRPYTDGALLVGDAAGFLDPFTGEGVFRALRGAEMAAVTALHALDCGNVSATALACYDSLRRRAFASKDHLCLLVQAFVAAPRLLDYAIPRLNRRLAANTLAAALGDYAPAGPALTPPALWRLLQP